MRQRWFWMATGLTGLLSVAILFDAVPLLRGPAPGTSEWYWPYLLRPMAQSWPVLLCAVGMGGWIWLWLAGRLSRRTGLIGLVALHMALQLGIVYADVSRPWLPMGEAISAELLDRTLAPLTNGYFWDAAHVDDMGNLLRDYSYAMPNFESEHSRTHPPGLVWLNWATIQLFERASFFNQFSSDYANTLRCTDLWLIGRPASVSAALFAWSLLPIVLASLTIPAAFSVARRLAADETQARLAATLLATLPALAVFSPKVDQIFVLLTLLLLRSTLIVVEQTKKTGRAPIGRGVATGVALGFMLLLSIGNAVLSILLLPLLLITSLPSGRGAKFNGSQAATNVAAYSIGGLLPLVLYPIIVGEHLLGIVEIVQVGLEQHYELVTLHRSYAKWLLWNWVDLLTYAGPVVLVGAWLTCQQALQTLRQRSAASSNPSRHLNTSVLALTVFAVILLLDLSGSARGEVGRIWLFLMGLLAVVSATGWRHVDAPRRRRLPLASLALTVAVGLAWEPVRPVIVVAQPPERVAPAAELTRQTHRLDPNITLSGSAVAVEGAQLTIELLWSADGASTYPYTAFVHVFDENDSLVTQQDRWSADGVWPPTCWRAGEQIVDRYQLALAELGQGEYRVFVGMYHGQTLERVGDAVEIGRFEY